MAVVRFGKIEAEAESGRDLLGILLDAGAPIAYICMAGSCGTCRVRVLQGGEHLRPRTGSEGQHRLSAGERLACQAVCTAGGDVTVIQD